MNESSESSTPEQDLPPLFDCHCHLQSEEFDSDRDAVIETARGAGVARVLAVAEDLEDAHRVLHLAESHPDFVVPALGVHPDRAPELDGAEIDAIERLIRKQAGRLGAIGEVGLDYRPCWDDAARQRQVDVLRRMCTLAKELNLPLSVHSRSAGHHALRVLEEEAVGTACLHAFDGKAAHGVRGAEAGYSFSIPPSVLRSHVKQKLVPRLPDESILLESDSPVLGPRAEERNEPANLRPALEFIAELRGVGQLTLARQLYDNTERLFPRLVAAPA